MIRYEGSQRCLGFAEVIFAVFADKILIEGAAPEPLSIGRLFHDVAPTVHLIAPLVNAADLVYSFPSFAVLLFPLPVASLLIVLRVARRRAKFQIAFDDLVHGGQEVFLGSNLPPRPYREHPGLGSHTPKFCSCAVRAQS